VIGLRANDAGAYAFGQRQPENRSKFMVQDMNMNKALSTWRGRWLVAVLLLGLTGGFTGAAGPNPVALTPAAVNSGETIDPNAGRYDATSGVLSFARFRKDATIREGLGMLAAVCKKNIVPSSGVNGPMTVSVLYNVTFEKALQAVLGNGFKYEQDGDFVRIYTAEEYKKIKEDPARMAYKVVTLYYITAQEAIKLVAPVLSGSTSAKVQASTAAQKSISGGEGSLTSSGGGDDLAVNDTVVIFDYPENIEKAEKVLRQLDVRPRQVLIEATILAARLSEDMQFGIDWNLLTGVPVNVSPTNLNANGVPVSPFPANIQGGHGMGTPAQTTGFANPGGSGLTVGFAAGNVQAIITALETITDTTLMANPKILAVNKQEGIVYIGRKIGYLSQTTQTQTSTTQAVSFLETGTRLVFRPYIGDDGYIRMDIYPKDSDGSLKQNNIPDETSTELRTNVLVKDGQTIVLGGLFRDSVVTSKSQVPVLGNLPLVGSLFRGKKDTVGREEVIIILTPHIVEEPSQTHPDKRVEDIRLKREAATGSLEAIDAAKIAEEAYAKAAKCYLEGETGKALFHLRIALIARPTYLEALRLRERIIAETDPEQFKRLDSIAEQEINKQEAEGWSRR
jgi:type IV pilus assembly protein PilQ